MAATPVICGDQRTVCGTSFAAPRQTMRVERSLAYKAVIYLHLSGAAKSATSEEWVLVLTLTTTHPALVSVLQPTSGLLYSQDKMDAVVTASFTTVSKMSHRCTK